VVIKSVGVNNFRCVQYEVLTCDRLTALVGANGSGKSTFLNAIDLFYSASPKVTPEDFYNGDIDIVSQVYYCAAKPMILIDTPPGGGGVPVIRWLLAGKSPKSCLQSAAPPQKHTMKSELWRMRSFASLRMTSVESCGE